MPDITETDLHLPVGAWIAPLELVTEDFQDDGTELTAPRIQNLENIKSEGIDLSPYLDDETVEVNEQRTQVETNQLTNVGPLTRNIYTLRGPVEVTVPISAWNNVLYAIMQGLDPLNAVDDAQDIRLESDGYDATDPYAETGTFDGVATEIDRVDSIITTAYVLLIQTSPGDAEAGESYILAPKLRTNKEEIQKTIQSEGYATELMFKSSVLNDLEEERWQNILPSITKTTGVHYFNAKLST